MLRIGFVGTGLIAWAHGRGLQAMIRAGTVDAAIGPVYDVDRERAVGFATAHAATVVASVIDVLDDCDAVWVCTPTVAHAEAVEQAAARGRAVFCEKPLTRDLAGADALAASVSASGVPAQVGLVLRSRPVFRGLRDIVASGELGPPMAAVFRDDQYFPIQGLYRSTWRADVAIAGGGCLIEHSIHDVDILRFCLGDVVEVAGRTANFSGHKGVEDVAMVTLQFASGATADLVSVWHDIRSRGSTRRIELFCQRGLVWLDDDFQGPLHVQTSEGLERRPCPSPEWVGTLALDHDDLDLIARSYVEADRAFVDALSCGTNPVPGFAEAVVAHRLVDAVYRSAAAGGQPVSVA